MPTKKNVRMPRTTKTKKKLPITHCLRCEAPFGRFTPVVKPMCECNVCAFCTNCFGVGYDFCRCGQQYRDERGGILREVWELRYGIAGVCGLLTQQWFRIFVYACAALIFALAGSFMSALVSLVNLFVQILPALCSIGIVAGTVSVLLDQFFTV
jgi:hypothetical protein